MTPIVVTLPQSQQATEQIVEPLANIHPLLGVIAFINLALIGALVYVIRNRQQLVQQLQKDKNELYRYIIESLEEPVDVLEHVATAMERVTDQNEKLPNQIAENINANLEGFRQRYERNFERIERLLDRDADG
jgi:predicted PurR-regulated permease PerM